MKEAFVVKRFKQEKKTLINTVNDILSEYQADGYDLTVRQIYYQFVTRDLFPEARRWRQIPNTKKWVKDPNGTKNAQPNYKWLAEILTEARMAGLIDWDMIVDRGRETVTPPAWEDPAEIVTAAADSFALDKWKDQTNHVEVMVEKQALEGVLIPVCERLGIRFTSNKGFSSASSMYEIGKRLAAYSRKGKAVWVLYLGDHDPSGMDMTRDIEERLNLFAGLTYVNVDRLALNMDQIQGLNLPPAPAKIIFNGDTVSPLKTTFPRPRRRLLIHGRKDISPDSGMIHGNSTPLNPGDWPALSRTPSKGFGIISPGRKPSSGKNPCEKNFVTSSTLIKGVKNDNSRQFFGNFAGFA